MAITKFGEYMRILRIKNNLLMKDTADKLNVKTPFLSASSINIFFPSK